MGRESDMRFIYFLLWIVFLGCQSAALTSAKLYLQEDEVAKAKEQLEKALVANSDHPESHFLLGKVHGLQGDYAAMVASLDRSLELSPKFSEDIAQLRHHYWAREYNQGVTLARAETPDFVAAREAFELATLINPDSLQSWRNLAFTHYQLGNTDGAIATYQRIVAIAPGDTAVLSNLGALCVQERRYGEAVQALSRLVEFIPDDFKTYVNLGIAHERLDQIQEAEGAYLRAVELGPGETMAHYGLGNFYWNREQYEAAREAYARAVALDPEDADARFNLAMTYLRLEDDDGALPLLEQLAAQMPENGGVWRQLSLIYARKDRVKESKEADARATALGH